MMQHSRHGNYVILLHGLARTTYSMKKLQTFLEHCGYAVLNLGYPSTHYPIETLTEKFVKPFIHAHCSDSTQKIHFVTHSMGGILVRYYLKQEKPANLGRVVMLAPPNQGTEVVDREKDWLIFKWLFGPAGQQLGTDSKSLPLQLGPVDFELGVIAGNRSVEFHHSFMISGPDDGKVGVERTKVEGMQDFLLVPNTHTFIMRDKFVFMQIDHFLRTGRFKSAEIS